MLLQKLPEYASLMEEALENCSEDGIPLDRAALAIAKPHFPNLDDDLVLLTLDNYAKEIRRLAGPSGDEDALVCALCDFLFRQSGFEGNRADYYSPDNSFMNRVLETRKGIPITLSLLMIETARRLDVRLYGIGLPCHFMVCYPTAGGDRYFDPFHGGLERDRDECIEVVRTLSGGSVVVGDAHFEPVSPRMFMARMLCNLRGIFRERQQAEDSVLVLNQLVVVSPEDPSVHLELAACLLQCGMPWEAQKHLERFAEATGLSSDGASAGRLAEEIRKRLVVLN